MEQDIPVKRPIVVVRCAAVMWFSIAEFSADLHKEHGFIFACNCGLPFFRRHIRIKVKQFLCCNKFDIPRKFRIDVGVPRLKCIQRVTNTAYDGTHGVLQRFQISCFAREHLFPVPLVYVNGMQIIQCFITPDRVHVRIKPLSRMEIIAVKRHALPFCKRMHHLRLGLRAGNIKAYGAFHTVQVVVKAALRLHEQRRCNALKAQRARKPILKRSFNEADCILRFIQGHCGTVAVWNDCVCH